MERNGNELVNILGGELTPIALAMRLNVRASKLMNEYGIRYENNRTHAGRTITHTLATQEASRLSRKQFRRGAGCSFPRVVLLGEATAVAGDKAH